MANTENCPKVGIVMGSDSDMPVMAKAADILEELGIPYEMTVISAHREPDVFFEYAKSAEEKGFKVIIAGAGMAARHMGIEVCGISCITNMAAGISKQELNHKEVQETADRVAKSFKKLVTEIIAGM